MELLNRLSARIKEWHDLGRPVFYAFFILAAALFISMGDPTSGTSRDFRECPEHSEVFESNTLGFSVCIPKTWDGRYGIVNTDHQLEFMYLGNGSSTQPVLLFGVVAVPEAYWDKEPAVRADRKELARDAGRVLAMFGFVGNDPNTADEGYRSLANDIPRIERSFAVADYKSADQVMEEYLTRLAIRGHGGRPFVAYEILGRDQGFGGFNYYVWLYSREYVKTDEGLKEGSEMSVPLVMAVASNETGALTVTNYGAPRSGADFMKDVEELFPERIAKSAWFAPDLEFYNERVAVLKAIAKAKAEAAFE